MYAHEVLEFMDLLDNDGRCAWDFLLESAEACPLFAERRASARVNAYGSVDEPIAVFEAGRWEELTDEGPLDRVFFGFDIQVPGALYVRAWLFDNDDNLVELAATPPSGSGAVPTEPGWWKWSEAEQVLGIVVIAARNGAHPALLERIMGESVPTQEALAFLVSEMLAESRAEVFSAALDEDEHEKLLAIGEEKEQRRCRRA